jgi:DNA-binding MarR family transcriptional regulator
MSKSNRTADNATEPAKVAMIELVSFRLHSVANLLSRGAAMRYRREFDVTLWEWRTIALVGATPELSLNELAKVAGLDKSQVSRVVAGLTERQLVLRRADSNDGRGIRLSLTADGQHLYERLIDAANERNRIVLGALTDEDCVALDRVLGKLERVARDFIGKEKKLAEGG